MIPPFCHHLIPLLPATGQQGESGAKAYAAAAKDAVRSAERIHGALKAACRVETALVPPDSAFFEDCAGQAKVRSAAWSVVRNASSLRWIIPTARPETIRKALPEDWVGKGYRNVCLAGVVDRPDRLAETQQQLIAVPSHLRMMLLPSLQELPDLHGFLAQIHWVVAVGSSEDGAQVSRIRETCRATDTAFLFLPLNFPAAAAGCGEDIATPDTGESSSPNHPFGPEVNLHRPTLPDLRRAYHSIPLTISTAMADSTASASTPASTHVARATEPPEHPAENPLEAPATSSAAVTETLIVEVASSTLTDGSTELSDEDRRDFTRLDDTVRRGVAAFTECGQALAEIHDRKLWKAGAHATWESYVREVLGMSKPHAHRLVQAARIASELSESLPTGNDLPRVIPASESQVRPLCRLKSQEQRTTAWCLAVKRADGQPTAKQISDVVAELMAEDPPSAAPRTTLKQQIAETIRELREANAARETAERIESLLHDLEKLLKLT